MQSDSRFPRTAFMAVVGLGLMLSGCVGSMVCDYVPSAPMTPISFPAPPVAAPPVFEESLVDAPLSGPPERGSRRASPQSPRAVTRAPGQFRLAPETPEPGTPEATREERQSDQREQELNRQIRGICRGC